MPKCEVCGADVKRRMKYYDGRTLQRVCFSCHFRLGREAYERLVDAVLSKPKSQRG